MLTRSRRLPPSRSIRDSGGRRRRAGAILALIAAACSLATPAGAHGFGQRYDLPLPLSLYLFGTAAVVVFSFVVAGLFVRRPFPLHRYPRVNLSAFSIGRIIAGRATRVALKLVALGLFVVTVAAGFFGDQNPFRNIAPTLVWVIWWVGLTFVSAFVGDIWSLIILWRTVFEWAESIETFAASLYHRTRDVGYPMKLVEWT